jgi:hypothetical protein
MPGFAQKLLNGPWTLIAAVGVIVLGIMGAGFVVTYEPQWYRRIGEERSTDELFVWGVEVFARGAENFRLRHGEYPEDAPPGQMPEGFAPYAWPQGEGCWGEFDAFPRWHERTPIGGQWDVARDAFGVTCAVGVHFTGKGRTRDDDYMRRIDGMVDDGNLLTGRFRRLGDDRYYFVVAE